MVGLLDMLGLGGGMPDLSGGGVGSDYVAEQRRKRVPYDRFGAPPTVGSTGGVVDILRALAPMQAPPPGSVPEMGLGEAAALTPQPPPTPAPQPAPPPAAPPAAAQPAPNGGSIFGNLAGLFGGAAPGATPVQTVPVGALPPGATPTTGFTPPPGASPPAGPPTPQRLAPPTADGVPPPGLFDRVGNFLGRNSNALMAFGAGLGSAPGWGQGLSRGFAGLAQGAQVDKSAMQENLTAQLLQNKLGIPRSEAYAMATNPTLMRSVLPQIFAQPELVTQEGIWGDKSKLVWDPKTRTLSPPTMAPPFGTRATMNGQNYVFKGGQWWKE